MKVLDLRIKKIPKKCIQGSIPYLFSLVNDKFKVLFVKLLGITITSLNYRFQINVINHLCPLKKCIIQMLLNYMKKISIMKN